MSITSWNGISSATSNLSPIPTTSFSPSTTAITYPLETWMGHLTNNSQWAPSHTCSYITLAIFTLADPNIDSTSTFSEYRNNITGFDYPTFDCRPPRPTPEGPKVPLTGEYYWPGACPEGWTSYVTTTTITSLADVASTARTATFRDAMCCPESYTSYLPSDDTQYFCTKELPQTPVPGFEDYTIQTWHLTGSLLPQRDTHLGRFGRATVSMTASRGNREYSATLSETTTLTYWPIFVRFQNSEPAAQGVFVPTKTGMGVSPNVQSGRSTTTGSNRGSTSSYKQGNNKEMILGISISAGTIVIGFIIWWIWYCRYSKRRKAAQTARKARREEEEEERRQQAMAAVMSGAVKPELMGDVYIGPDGGVRGNGGIEGHGARKKGLVGGEEGKPELMGDVYVGPHGGRRDVIGKAELTGKTKGKDGRGVVTSLEELKYDENEIGEYVDYSELVDQRRRRGVAGMELDHQSGRRNIADAELDGRERERRAAELDAARTHQQRIARKAVPSGANLPKQSSAASSYLHSPIISGPMPDYTTLYPSSMNPEAEEEERRFEYREQRLRERREQLAREEEELREQRLQRRSGV